MTLLCYIRRRNQYISIHVVDKDIKRMFIRSVNLINVYLIPIIWSSEQAYMADALAITGDEGRGSLRKASGSWQSSFDPEMSEWENPADISQLLLSEYIG